MAAFDFHRKLIEDCSTQCDPIQNPCTPFCSQLCPTFCTTTQPPQSPPPPPPPTGDYFLVITPPKPHHSSLSIPLKISLVILVLTFSLFLLYTLYKFYTVWYRSRTRRPPPPSGNQETVDEFVDHDVLDHPIWYIRTIGLQPSVISAITVVKYNKTDGLIEGTDCSVCLSDFEQDEMLRLLPKCNHAFHISCIDTWLRSHTNCPLCRAGIVKNTTTTNSSSSDQNLDDSSGQIEETQMAISISDEVHGEDDQGSELRIGVIDEEDLNDNNDKGEVVGGGGTSDFLIIRRSVSLNDYAACRVRSDVNNNNNNNCYYSDRHQVQIQPVEGDWELSRRDLEMI